MAKSHIVLLLGAVFFAGCGPSYQVAEVDGVLLVKGKPANKIQIQFHPDKDTKGPSSTALTDGDGRFTMTLMEPGRTSQRLGAVVGWHRVVLTDVQLAESASGRDVPMRINPELMTVSTSTLTQEVKSGKQTLEIKVP